MTDEFTKEMDDARMRKALQLADNLQMNELLERLTGFWDLVTEERELRLSEVLRASNAVREVESAIHLLRTGASEEERKKWARPDAEVVDFTKAMDDARTKRALQRCPICERPMSPTSACARGACPSLERR